MPVAAVDIYNLPEYRKDNVRSAREIAPMKAKAITEAVRDSSKQSFLASYPFPGSLPCYDCVVLVCARPSSKSLSDRRNESLNVEQIVA